jgi:hypothetical protein
MGASIQVPEFPVNRPVLTLIRVVGSTELVRLKRA